MKRFDAKLEPKGFNLFRKQKEMLDKVAKDPTIYPKTKKPHQNWSKIRVVLFAINSFHRVNRQF